MSRNKNAEGIKFNIKTGEIVMKLGVPKESGLEGIKFNPTARSPSPKTRYFSVKRLTQRITFSSMTKRGSI